MTDEAKEKSLLVGSHKLIYIFEIERSEQHEGRIKVGEASIELPIGYTDFDNVPYEDMRVAARKRIDSYTKTSDTEYTIRHLEMAVRPALNRETKEPNGNYEGFRDYAIHQVLKNSGFEKDNRREDKINGEWFSTTGEAAMAAIKAYKNHKNFIETEHFPEIELYPEQEVALAKTIETFKNATLEKPKKMLWNAKMRFGKTLTAYATINELSKKGISKVLILTHYPAVRDGWYEDYRKSSIRNDWTFGDKTMKVDFNEIASNNKFVWFASMQDVRGSYDSDDISDADFEKLKKNSELFSTQWDLIITDEAHLGTLTELAKKMYIALKSSRYLDLSGTPFNILKTDLMEDAAKIARFTHDGTYSWSYVDEQEAKENWYRDRPDEPNPYSNRPEVKFITYDVADAISQIPLSQNTMATYSLTELFRVRSDDPTLFEHERLVRDVLNKLRGEERFVDKNAHLFPFSDGYGVDFNHTFWLLPNVAAVNAMQKLLEKQSTGFSGYKIVNATGEGVKTVVEDTALKAVKNAIANHDKTITLSQQMLTTGVTVPEWNAVLHMNNTKSPMNYMQASFRAASSGSLPDGRVKETAYIFDFNPDRCLEVIVEAAQFNAKERLDEATTQKEEREIVEDFVKRMPILAFNGATFEERDSRAIMEEINRVFIEETVSNGFDSRRIFNNDALAKFDLNKARILNMLNGNKNGKDKVKLTEVTDDDRKRLKELNDKNNSEENLTADEKKEKTAIESKVKEERKNRETAEKILVSVITRSPMLVFAADVHEGDIELETFNERIDDESWNEFMDRRIKRIMPEEIRKIGNLDERFDMVEDGEQPDIYWEDIHQFYNKTIFEGACRRVREMADEANAIADPILHGLYKIHIFGTFRNPDKETVLTPSRVVQLQLNNTLGGIELFDLEASTAKDFFVWVKNEDGKRDSIHINDAVAGLKTGDYTLDYDFKTVEGLEDFWTQREFSMYDPNSKSALYPLFAAMSRFAALKNIETVLTDAELWDRIIDREIFVNTRVKYSALIAKRMLTRDGHDVNATTIDIVRLLNSFKAYNSLKKADRPEGYKKIDNIHEGLAVILRLANHRFMELYADKAIYDLSQDGSHKFQAIIGKIESGNYELEEMMEVQKLIEAFKDELPKFDVVVSNPPYQMDTAQKETNGQKTVTNVFQEFQQVSNFISKIIAMIYPADRWLQQSGKGMAEFGKNQANSRHLSKVVYFPRSSMLFHDVDFGAASMVLIDNSIDNNENWALVRFEIDGTNTTSVVNLPGDEIISFDTKMNEITEKVRGVSLSGRTLSQRGFSQKLFGLESAFAEENPEKVIKSNDDFSNKPKCSSIRALINDRAGKAGKAQWFWLEENEVSSNKALIKRWKVILSSVNITGINGRSPDCSILPPNSVYGRSRLGIAFFESSQEAQNFFMWLSTDIIRYLQATSGDLITSYAKNVPDLEDYSNSNELFNDLPTPELLNKKLIKLYKLEEYEDYIATWVKDNLAPFSKSPLSGLTLDERNNFKIIENSF